MTVHPQSKISFSVGSISNGTAYWSPYGTAGIESRPWLGGSSRTLSPGPASQTSSHEQGKTQATKPASHCNQSPPRCRGMWLRRNASGGDKNKVRWHLKEHQSNWNHTDITLTCFSCNLWRWCRDIFIVLMVIMSEWVFCLWNEFFDWSTINGDFSTLWSMFFGDLIGLSLSLCGWIDFFI